MDEMNQEYALSMMNINCLPVANINYDANRYVKFPLSGMALMGSAFSMLPVAIQKVATSSSAGKQLFEAMLPDGEHYVGDISKKDALEAFAKYVIEKHGHIDYLINNALPLMKGIDQCSYEEFKYTLAVGVTVPFYLTKLPISVIRKNII